MDFFTRDQYLTPISELIRYYQTFPDFYYRLSNLAEKSVRGILWDIDMQSDYNNYVHLRDEAKAQVFASLQINQVGRFKVAYVQSSPYLQSSLFSEEVFANTNADLVMFYSTKGKVSIRRNNELVSCRNIALTFPKGEAMTTPPAQDSRATPQILLAVILELQSAVAKVFGHHVNTEIVNTQIL